ncbi:hypothetical protein BU16DRAFT_377596 [Lophium mytilinum]|uniref:F-box domain-containing protein n=1 Tax=Lophium mytilinum TaxID=390894 RepID=A0A6A6QW38_9PEZI|nr:hypothetical protein BU16DRAFT_377596 [Lophium mytilinum]
MQPDAFLVHMASQLKPLLTLIKDDSLRSFSWDMGTRMPKSILSHISTKQASITSFSMTAAVHQWPDQGEASPYEAFRLAQLRKISWIADGNSHLFALRRLLSSSSGHLQEIVIDGKNFDPLQPFSTVSHNDDLAYKIPQETQGEREVLFPSLKKLSLSRVYLGNVRVPALPWLPPRWVAPVASLDEGDRADTVLAFNYFQLRSLKLEKCLRVDHLLSVLSGSSMSMELTSFELIVDSRVIPRHDHYRLGTCVEAFLESFEGLKNLYLDYSRLPNFFQAISRHKATLEKLVYQQREQYDNQFLWKKELSMLDLKCLGVGLKPSDLLPCLIQLVLGPKISEHTIYRPSVQLLHIRDGVQLTCKFKGPKRLEAEFPRALPEIYNFARWAFGPAGLPNLEILAYGDFAHQGRQPNILLCKSQLESDGETPYRQLTKKDVRLWEVVRENSDFLETCPETSLMY